MNAHATVADTGVAIRLLSPEQITAGAVLEQDLRTIHALELVVADLVGTASHQAKRAVLTAAQRAEAGELARLFQLHVAALAAISGAPTPHHHRTLKAEAGDGGRG